MIHDAARAVDRIHNEKMLRLAAEPAGDMVIDPIAVAVGATHAGLDVHVIIMQPFRLRIGAGGARRVAGLAGQGETTGRVDGIGGGVERRQSCSTMKEIEMAA